MRKRLVIGAIAAVVIGVAAYMLSQPRKGTLEWHKAEYFNATERTMWDRLVCAAVVPAVVQRHYERYRLRTLQFHERELIKAVLDASMFVLTNGWPPALRLLPCGPPSSELYK